jgi:uncharacterized protein YndB with AHSA1/START domain
MPDSIRVERDLPAPVEVVWGYLTEQQRLAEWFWPSRLEPVVQFDSRVGGHFEFASAPAELKVKGTVRSAEAPHRLELGWQWEGELDVSIVVIELEPKGPGTVLTLDHSGLPDEKDGANHEQGWGDCLDRLVTALKAVA